MPAKSAAQRRWAFAVKGTKWARAHHFDTPGKLPARVGKKRKPKKRRKAVPTVGKKKFPYSSTGKKKAKAYAKKTGKKMVSHKKKGSRKRGY